MPKNDRKVALFSRPFSRLAPTVQENEEHVEMSQWVKEMSQCVKEMLQGVKELPQGVNSKPGDTNKCRGCGR